MKLIKQLSCACLLIFVTLKVSGQDHKSNNKAHKEKIQAMKVGYITEKLNLTSKEAEQFWPVYNEFDKKMENIHKTIRKSHKKSSSIDEMSDSEVDKMLESHNELRQKELDTQKEYNTKFKLILPVKKVAKLYRAEHNFKRELLKKLKNKKGGSNNHDLPPPPSRGR